MSDPRIENLFPDFGDFTPDLPKGPVPDISFPVPEAQDAPAGESGVDSIADRFRRLAQDSFGEALRNYQKTGVTTPTPQPQEEDFPAAGGVSLEFDFTSEPEPIPEPEPVSESKAVPTPDHLEEPSEFLRAIWELQREGRPDRPGEPKPAPEPEPEPDLQPAEPAEPPRPRVTVGEDGIITIQYGPVSENPGEEPKEDPDTSESADEAVPVGDSEPATAPGPERNKKEASPLSWQEKLLRPLTYLFAIPAVIRAARQADAQWDDNADEAQDPELSPKAAARFYSAQAKPLRTRSRIAFFLFLILAWISFQLPMAGLLGKSTLAQAGVCLVLMLAVMITALDVVSAGLRQLCDLRPGMEALAALSAGLACVDCVLVMTGHGTVLPYSGPAALSLVAALWGQRLSCTALRRTFATAVAKNPTVLTCESKSGRSGPVLMRAPVGSHSIVRRSEQPNLPQTVYAVAAPILIVLSLLLAVLSTIGNKGSGFLHTFSALIAVSAALSAFIAFPLPYAVASRRLRNIGAALLGWAGCAEIGQKRRVLITDDDLFPNGTVNFTAINIQEGAFIDKVVSYTASLLAASGSGVAGKFTELVTRRGYSMVEIGSYTCHEGGGLSAVIREEQILVGSANYMTLMGIHLPSNMEARNSICTAINGELVAVFTMEYTPVTSVQDALVSMLRGRIQGIFAIRDFNITPLMLRHLFRIPTDNLAFPSFRERYRMAGASVTGKTTPASAVIARSGMMPLVETAETGRRLYNTCRINTAISLIGTLLGLFILFLLLRTGSVDTASAGNVLSYMLLWALPVVILAMGHNR